MKNELRGPPSPACLLLLLDDLLVLAISPGTVILVPVLAEHLLELFLARIDVLAHIARDDGALAIAVEPNLCQELDDGGAVDDLLAGAWIARLPDHLADTVGEDFLVPKQAIHQGKSRRVFITELLLED